MKQMAAIIIGTIMALTVSTSAFGHCEIPCGIYDDQMRIELIREHITTIEKSMKMIRHLTGEDHENANQLIRWVVNKEDHADKLQKIVTQYFMTQRIKLDAAKYAEKITLLHHMLILAMQCKQTTDFDHVEQLRKIVDQFEDLYFSKKKKE